jgi:hypothetical protein
MLYFAANHVWEVPLQKYQRYTRWLMQMLWKPSSDLKVGDWEG